MSSVFSAILVKMFVAWSCTLAACAQSSMSCSTNPPILTMGRAQLLQRQRAHRTGVVVPHQEDEVSSARSSVKPVGAQTVPEHRVGETTPETRTSAHSEMGPMTPPATPKAVSPMPSTWAQTVHDKFLLHVTSQSVAEHGTAVQRMDIRLSDIIALCIIIGIIGFGLLVYRRNGNVSQVVQEIQDDPRRAMMEARQEALHQAQEQLGPRGGARHHRHHMRRECDAKACC